MSAAFSPARKTSGKLRASEFRALFTPRGKVAALLDHALSPLVTRVRQSSPCTCAVPISDTGRFGLHPPDGTSRGSDRYGRNWTSPCSTSRPMRSPSFHGSRNSLLGTRRRFGMPIPGADFMVDHHILRHADHVAISNSTFSFTAAMLNERAETFMRPHPNRRELVAFDPWDSPSGCRRRSNTIVSPRLSGRSWIRRFTEAMPSFTSVPYCSPFVNLARSVRKELRIYELEDDEGSLDQFRQRRGAKQIPHLIVEDATSLPRVLEEASETLSQSASRQDPFFCP